MVYQKVTSTMEKNKKKQSMEGRLHFLKGQVGQISLRKQYPLGICSIKDFSGLAAIMQLYAFSQKFHVNDSINKGLNCSSAKAYESQNLQIIRLKLQNVMTPIITAKMSSSICTLFYSAIKWFMNRQYGCCWATWHLVRKHIFSTMI